MFKISALILFTILLANLMSVVNVEGSLTGVRLEGQRGEGTWTPGLVSGWDECDNVPFRFIVNYKFDEQTTLEVWLYGYHRDGTDSVANYGIDFFENFEISGEYEGSPSISWVESGPTTVSHVLNPKALHEDDLETGVGTGEVVDTTWGGKELKYILTIDVVGDSEFTLTWEVHLAKGGENGVPSGQGASNWDHDNIHVSEEPQGERGSRDVPIAKPGAEESPEVVVDKTVEAEVVRGIGWTLTKSADPTSLNIPVGGTDSVTYTIDVEKVVGEEPVYRVRGVITLTNFYDKIVCVDVLDQIQSALTEYPTIDPTKLVAYESWNDQEVPKAQGGGPNFEPGVLVLYFPGPSSSDWLEIDNFPDDVDPDSDNFYNIIWIGYNPDNIGGNPHDDCPSADPDPNADTVADWDPTGGASYQAVDSASQLFSFIAKTSGPETVIVYDEESWEGPFSITSITADREFDSDTYWEVSETETLTITKEVQCEGPGSGTITDTAIAVDNLDDPDFTASSNEIVVNVEQFELEPSVEITKELTSGSPTVIGENVVFNIVVTNTGDTVLTDVDVIDTYDTAYLDFMSATPATPVESPPGTLTWNDIESQASGGTFDPGDIITLTVNFQAIAETPEGEDTENCASVTSGELDEGPACDSVEINEPLEPGIEITKELTSEDPTTVGSNVVFEITIENTGDVVLSDVDVTDTYDTAYLDFVSANPTETSNDETLGNIFWDNIESNAPGGTFDPSETITITLTFTATATTPENSKAENCVTVTTEYSSYTLYGIIGDYLVTIDESTGDATEVAMLGGSQDLVSAIAFDSNSGTLYGLARYGGIRTPHLVTIDPCTGVVTLIAQITLPGSTVYFAEGLAIDPSGTIYVSMSIDGNVPDGDFYSETLATVNAFTAVATSIGTIAPTVQTEADGLEFAGTTLYATDDPGSGPTNIYTINTGTAVATFKGTLSSPRFNNVNDMAYNSDSTLLYGFDPGAYTNGQPRHLCTISHPGTAAATDIGEIHTAAEFGGGSTRGIAWVFAECPKVCDDVEIGEEIQEIEYDFGDAPDPVLSTSGKYPTLLVNNGARHIITDLWLGDIIDAEADGQPTSLADGDDNNPAIGPDDEDGVSFLGAGSPGGPYQKPYQSGKNGAVEIKVSGTFTTAYIFGWVDWNQDGDWGDAGEDLFGGGYLVTTTGLHTIDFIVPIDAKPGNTYGRFRLIEGSVTKTANEQINDQITFIDLSINADHIKNLQSVQDTNGVILGPTGSADNGEVEDYLVDPETNVPAEKPPDPGPGQPVRATVGGYMLPVNKLAILVPYLIVIGLIGAITIAIGYRKKRQN